MSITNIFTKITPYIYWLLILLWAYISIFYIRRIFKTSKKDRLLKTLITLLALDAVRTLIESSYFGIHVTSLTGFIDIKYAQFLSRPEMLFFPKVMNLIVAITIIFLLIKKWIPVEGDKIEDYKLRINEQNKILDQVPVSIIITDLNNRITYVNNKLCLLTGYKKDFLIGKTPNILNSGEYSVTDDVNLWATLNENKEWHGQFRNKKKNGELYWEKAIISPLYNSDGIKDHYLSISEDITEKVQMKKEKQLLQEELNQTQRLKSVGLLVGGIAHDFNNELTGIMSAAQLLNNPKRVPDETSRKFVDIILKSSKRSANLTENLLAFSKKRNNKISPISLFNVINDTIEILKPTTNRYITINSSFDYENDMVMASQAEIHSTLINLGINASHAIDDVGTISYYLKNITVDEVYIKENSSNLLPGLYCQVEVCDTGKGIPDDIIGNIFDDFFTTKGKDLGTGLGLSSSKRVIEKLNGEIRVKSKIGEGTTFTILLPSHTT